MGEGACRWTLGWGGRAGVGGSNPRGESWAAAGGRDSGPAGAAGGRSLTCWSPARVPGWSGSGSARTGSARGSGTGRRLSGPGGCDHIPRSAPPVSAPPLGSGSGARRAARARAGGGVGAGPAWARPGAWGPRLAPPERRAPDSALALRPLSGVKSWAPAAARPRADLGAPRATESGHADTTDAQTRHTRGYTHSHPETLCYSHLRLQRTGKHPGTRRVHTPHVHPDVGTLPQPSPLWTRTNTDIRRHQLS